MYKLELYDPQKNLKAAQIYRRRYLAVCSGMDWNELTQGNSYKIIRPESTASNYFRQEI